MKPWKEFEEEVSNFYNIKALHDAFVRCEKVETANDLEHMLITAPYFAGHEHTEIGEERDLQGRFNHNVMDHVDSVRKALFYYSKEPTKNADILADILPRNLSYGSAKTIPKADRESYEPDVVIKIPGTGHVDQVVRVIGELKYFVTCDIALAWKAPDKHESRDRHSARHVLGKFTCICVHCGSQN